ncbi:MAG: D-alanine--D-alanine ligase [Bauldia sp.]|nr:D-alanine--D-alanine ligase [Bauldia sp.]
MTKRVAVLMGGWSSERSISLVSGKACAAALADAGYDVTPIDVGRDVASVLSELRPAVAFNALHGPYGEDGTIQGVLEILGIPYTHSGVLASALAMHKIRAKPVLAAAGVPVAESIALTRQEAAREHPMKPPYVVKPIQEGSSYGVVIVREGANSPARELLSDDWRYSDEVMAERYVPGRELTCGVIGDRALDVIEITTKGRFYDFEAKYSAGGSIHILPARLLPVVYQNVRMLALRAHQALGCRGVSRSDFRFDEREDGSGELICLEVNTQPGMTPTSLVPEMAAHAGMSFRDLVSWMVEDASCGR